MKASRVQATLLAFFHSPKTALKKDGKIGKLDSVDIVQKFLDLRVAVDVLEDILLDELAVAISYLDSGDIENAKKMLGSMRNAILETTNATDKN